MLWPNMDQFQKHAIDVWFNIKRTMEVSTCMGYGPNLSKNSKRQE
jgi:hypothetical protein